MKFVLGMCLGTISCALIPQELLNKADGATVHFFLQFRSPMQVLDDIEQAGYVTADGRVNAVVAGLQQFARNSWAKVEEEIKRLMQEGSIQSVNRYYISNTMAIVGNQCALRSLAEFKDVYEVVSNHWQTANTPLQSSDIPPVNWSNQSVNTKLDSVIPDRAKYLKSNLRYGNADSGVDFIHPSLFPNYAGNLGNGVVDHNYAWFDGVRKGSNFICSPESAEPCDDFDHGTITTSIAVGQNKVGMMPGAKWMACRNMSLMKGSTEAYLHCLQFFLAPTNLQYAHPRPDLRPHVLSNSYACTREENCYTKPFEAALRALYLADIFVVSSVGNSGTQGCGSIQGPPAIYTHSFNVGGGSLLGRSGFSSLGPVVERSHAIDIIAPATNIVGARVKGGFGLMTGTSASCPIVAGAALILMQECPHLQRNPHAVKNALLKTATPLFSSLGCGSDTVTSLPNNEFGYGFINLTGAILYCKGN